MRSYAQMFEDRVLWQALQQVERGFYVDVGAGHPEEISVTKAFYDLGWRGINIEPSSVAALYATARPRDLTLQVAAGPVTGIASFLYFDGNVGYCADRPEVRRVFESHGHRCKETHLSQRTLDSILEECPRQEIHFLKIDVEGYEKQVLMGLSLSVHRPWIIVVEATLPTTEERTDHLWDRLILDQGYDFAYFDGLNCFYRAREHPELVIEAPQVMKTAFVYVSYHNDLHWLSYSLRFLRRNWREPGTKIVVRIEPDCVDIVKSWAVPDVEYRVIGQWADGYAYHMYMKLTADEHSDADLIMLIDSDVMLIRPCWLDDLLVDGKAIVEWLPWDQNGERYWRGCSSKALGIDVDVDYMVRPPFCVWRPTFAKVRTQIEQTVGMPLQHFMYSEQQYTPQNFDHHKMPLADYEVLGCYAVKREPELYTAIDSRTRQSTWPFRVYWSHGDWSEELRQEFERRLSI